MSQFNDLPRRSRSHEVEGAAVAAFEQRCLESKVFVFQGADRHDYGTDGQIEVIDDGSATNVRVHVQLKGTERALNADGSLSVQVDRTNLNYLLMQEFSFYVCFHVPTCSLRYCPVADVLRHYEHSGKDWGDQESLTVTFTKALTVECLVQLASLARARARSSRDLRLEQAALRPAEVLRQVFRAAPHVDVPEDATRAAQILDELYEKNADDVISAAFSRFAAVLGPGSDAMGICYMAEINLAMDGQGSHPERLTAAIDHFRAQLGKGRFHDGSLHYSIGNAFSALRDEQSAKTAYEAALSHREFSGVPHLAAQGHKNLGTSLERLGEKDAAVEQYREALRLCPDLAEAHHAMGFHFMNAGRYDEALAHFDRVVFAERNQGRTSGVAGWRAFVLFNLGDGRSAFREINSLLSQSDIWDWIWPWCARLVGTFGRSTPGSAEPTLAFWQRYVRAHPDQSVGHRELLLANFHLRGTGGDVGKTYDAFRAEFDEHIVYVDAADAALPWDRLGHWAQDEGNWTEAERCFRKAYDLEGGHYGYCLGTALNFLDRFEESLPILLEQAQVEQPDAMSWFQVASAYSKLNRDPEAIDAYRRATELDSDYALAFYELGGAYWSAGDKVQALASWKVAIERFPDHELATKLKQDFSKLF